MTTRRRPWRLVLTALWVACLALGTVGQAVAQDVAQDVGGARQAHGVTIDGLINPVRARCLERALAGPEAAGAGVVGAGVHPPGGLLDSTRRMVETIFASGVPVIVYVAPSGGRAASAGTFITAAGHIAAMAPGTNIGAASPIGGQGEELPETLKEKIFEDTAAEIRAIAERRGRAVEPLEATVLEAKAYTANEALELGIIDLVVSSVSELLDLIDGREVLVETEEGEVTVTLETAGLTVRDVEMGFFDRLLSFIADPNIAFLLLSLGGLGLVVEMWSPGLIFPGVSGLIALVLAFMALGNLPGNWAGIALLLLAFVLAMTEASVDGFGVLGALGIVSFVLGGVLLFAHFGTPSPVLPSLRVSLWVLVPVSAAMAAGVGGLTYSMVQSRREQHREGPEELPFIGAGGVVTAVLNPRGTVRVRGQMWGASAADGERIERGAGIVVVAEEGALLTVERRAEAAEPGAEPQA